MSYLRFIPQPWKLVGDAALFAYKRSLAFRLPSREETCQQVDRYWLRRTRADCYWSVPSATSSAPCPAVLFTSLFLYPDVFQPRSREADGGSEAARRHLKSHSEGTYELRFMTTVHVTTDWASSPLPPCFGFTPPPMLSLALTQLRCHLINSQTSTPRWRWAEDQLTAEAERRSRRCCNFELLQEPMKARGSAAPWTAASRCRTRRGPCPPSVGSAMRWDTFWTTCARLCGSLTCWSSTTRCWGSRTLTRVSLCFIHAAPVDLCHPSIHNDNLAGWTSNTDVL